MPHKQHPQKAIIVLGMHRSGTSALTGTLSQLGFDLGSSLMRGNEFNKKGYWENQKLVSLNDSILEHFDRTWYDYRSLHDNWQNVTNLESIYKHGRVFLTSEFSNSSLWAMKDPRLCRLLPFWKKLLLTIDADIHYIICIRHPLEVGNSIVRRDKIPFEYALLLWIVYTLDSIIYTDGLQRTIINYADLLKNWPDTLSPFFNSAGIAIADNSATKDKVSDFLTQDLHHHNINDLRMRDSDLSRLATTLYTVIDKDKTEITINTIRGVERELMNYISSNDILLDNIRQLCGTNHKLLQRGDDISEQFKYLVQITLKKSIRMLRTLF